MLLLCYRWNRLLEQISEQQRSSKALLGLWQRYKLLYSQCVTAVQKQEDRADRLLKSATDREITEEESSAWIKDCSVSRDEQRNTGSLVYDCVIISFIKQVITSPFKCFRCPGNRCVVRMLSFQLILK